MKPIPQPYRARLGALGLVALASGVVVLAGCGGGSSSNPGVAKLSSGTGSSSTGSSSTSSEAGSSSPEDTANAQKHMVAYARCMRSHGVPGFPEPSEGRIEIQRSSRNGKSGGLNPESAQFQSADKTCRKLLPNGGIPSPQAQKQAQERALAFSRCMRSHGVPNFPTPTISGNKVTQKISSKEGIDPSSPQFQSAQKACQAYFGPAGGKGLPKGALGARGAAPGGPSASHSGSAVVVP
jgi:hypothetical protein